MKVVSISAEYSVENTYHFFFKCRSYSNERNQYHIFQPNVSFCMVLARNIESLTSKSLSETPEEKLCASFGTKNYKYIYNLINKLIFCVHDFYEII